jgi:hypothetical protein
MQTFEVAINCTNHEFTISLIRSHMKQKTWNQIRQDERWTQNKTSRLMKTMEINDDESTENDRIDE